MIDLIPNKHRYTSSFPKLTMLLEEELDLLTFIAEEDGVTFGFERYVSNDYLELIPFVSYSIDNGNSWIELKEIEETIPINKGLKLIWKGDAMFISSANNSCSSSYSFLTFSSSGLFSASGSIKLSFNKKINNLTENAKKVLLNLGLQEDLVTWYLNNIYTSNLFLEYYQNILKDTPDSEIESLGVSREEVLPALIAMNGIISYPETFNTEIAANNLLSAKNLKIDALNCMNMFYKNSIVEAPDIIEVYSISNFRYLFQDCLNLEKAPLIKGIFSTQYQVRHMFYNCPKLNYVKVIGEIINSDAATIFCEFLYGVAPEGVVESNLDIPVPEGWTLKKVEK